MDKKPSHQPPKFHPAHHPPPPMVPRQIIPTIISQTGSSQHHQNVRPSPIISHPTTSPGISAFELNYATLPSFSQLQTGSHGGPSPFSINTPPQSPSSLTPEPPPPQKLISEQARIRRDRMMKRGRTLSTEQTTPKDSIDLLDEPSPGPTPPLSSPGLLAPPQLLEGHLMALELPPHRRDTLEKIPRRARSQSWLVRTRHLLDDDKLVNRTPWIAHVLYGLSIFLLILTFPFCLPFCAKVAREYERVVMFRTGRLMKGTKGPGLYFVIPCIDTYKVVDLRVLSFDVPPQEILSRDSVTVSVEAVIYFRISNPIISVTNVNDAQFSTKLLAQTTLRNVLGTKTLSEILQERDNISSVTEKVLDEGTDPWGVKVQRVEIKDIRLPHQLTKAMATEAEATRDARAKVVSADGERNASRTLVEAANEIRKNPVALHLRFLQTMSKIAAQRNHTIVVPVSIEIVRVMAGKLGTIYKTASYSKYE